MAHVAEWKKETVHRLSEVLDAHETFGIVDIHGISAPLIQKMRRDLRENSNFVMAKNKLIFISLQEAFEQKGEKIDPDMFAELMKGKQTALIGTDMNAFKLYALMKATLTNAPAKAGDIAPDDIVVQKGETPFKPGPIVGEFQKAGIPAAIENGKVVIKKTKTLVNKGEPIPGDVALMLTKLEIYPMTVGLNLIAAYEDGILYEPDVLDIDQDRFMQDLRGAISSAFNLSVFAAYPTKLNIKALLSSAHTKALNLAVNAEIFTPETLKILIAKANMQLLSVASHLSDEALDDELKGRLTSAPAAPAASAADNSEKKEDEPEEEEEEVSEEEAAAGLGALFG